MNVCEIVGATAGPPFLGNEIDIIHNRKEIRAQMKPSLTRNFCAVVICGAASMDEDN